MTLVEQLWGSTNERLHTVGTVALALSFLVFVVVHPMSKVEGLVVFYLFSSGCALIGYATTRNAWSRWRTGEDTLILLRRRDANTPEHSIELHLFGRSVCWVGRVAHVDVGTFSVRAIPTHATPPSSSAWGRGYQMFRAVYWAICSSIPFQAAFGIVALTYGTWLMSVVFEYMMSEV